MAKVSNVSHSKKPSDEVIEQASQEFTVTDAKGRKLALKKPSVLMQYRLVEMLGETANNEAYVKMVMPIYFLKEIDGNPIGRISTKAELEALIERLDDYGLKAIMEGIQKHFSAAASEQEFKEAVKK